MLAYTIGDLTKAWEATEIEFYMQAPQSLQAPIISNLRVCRDVPRFRGVVVT